jgi:hypothetical protein
MAVQFEHTPHPRIEDRRRTGPPLAASVVRGLNGRIALVLTRAVGSMWCAYAFALLALVALPDALASGGVLPIVTWISQTFIQLVMLSVIMVGQNILGQAADRRAEMTYTDADATLHETAQLQRHLAAQDEAMSALMRTVERLEASLAERP